MKKQQLKNRAACAALVCAAALGADAQGYISDAASSSAVLTRDPARQASTEIDAVVTNPAGTAFLEDGLHMSVSGMFAFRNIEADNIEAPSSILKTKEKSMLPALQLAYKKKRWTVSASFASEGGFGKRNLKDGSIFCDNFFDALSGDEYFAGINDVFQENNVVVNLLGAMSGITDTGISGEDKISILSSGTDMTLYNWTTRLGVAFGINKNLSAYVGVKANYVSSTTDLDAYLGVYRPSTGEKWSYSDYSEKLTAVINSIPNIDDELKNSYKEIQEGTASLFDEAQVSPTTDVHGWGFAPIIGIDYKLEKFNFGAKYEFASRINAKGTDNFDIPAYLSAGMGWQITQKWKLAAGGNVVFPTDDNISGSYKTKTAFDVSASATWDITDKWLISGGYTYGKLHMVYPESPFPIIPTTADTHHKVSFGAAFSPTGKLQVNLGMSSYIYTISYLGTTNVFINGEEQFSYKAGYKYKPRVQIALGVNYRI